MEYYASTVASFFLMRCRDDEIICVFFAGVPKVYLGVELGPKASIIVGGVVIVLLVQLEASRVCI